MDGFGLLLLVALAVIILGGAFRRRRASGTIETGHGDPVVLPGGPESSDALLPARWVGPGEVILIGQVPVHGGLFYFGHTFRLPTGTETIAGPRPDAAIIDPRFPVGGIGREGEVPPLMPPHGYDMMDRRQRRHFLLWLSGPRDEGAGTDPGFVLIYFHGLERRLMVDRSPVDREALRTEVRRLATQFGARPWFRDLANDLLQASAAVAGVPETAPAPAADLWAGSGIAPAALVHLGRRAARDGRFDAEGALLWLLADRAAALRPPVGRVFELFARLFARDFRARWPEGFPVPVPAERLRFHVYRASDGAFETRYPLGDGTVPDLRPVWEMMAPLRDLADVVAAELEPYARFVTRNPDRRDSAEAAALLPPGLAGADLPAPASAGRPVVPPAPRSDAPVVASGVSGDARAAAASGQDAAVLAAAAPTISAPAMPVREAPTPERAPAGVTVIRFDPVAAAAALRSAAETTPSPAAWAPPAAAPPPPFAPPPPVRPVAAAEPGRATPAPAPRTPDGLDQLLAGRTAGIVPLAAMLKAALLAPTWPLPLAALGDRLDRRDVAFEPDPRCGALTPAPEASLAFFPAAEGGLHRPDVLAAGRHLVEAVALMAGAGTVPDADFAFLDAALQLLDGPTPQERTRLWAYVAALYAPPSPGKAVAEALGRLPAGERLARIRAIRRVFPLEDARTRVCALRLAMVLDGLGADDLI